MVRPLAGLRVLDLTTFLSGPLATRALAQLGADVVKVEPPGLGDPTRSGMGLQPGDAPSPYWLALHRDRRSMVLDLKHQAGRTVLLDLVAVADVVVDNFRPGVMDRFGLSPDELRAANPRLVSCSITGFGADGPMADRAAIDGPIQAFTGALELTTRGDTSGLPMPVQVADIAGAAQATQAVLAALYQRERTGQGSHIEVTLVESLLQWLSVADRFGTMASPVTMVLEGAGGGRFLVQTPVHFQERFAELVASVEGCETIGTDPRFADAPGRFAHADAYLAIVARAAATRSREEWLDALHAAGVPAAPVQGFDEALVHPQVAGRDVSAVIDVPGHGEVRALLGPVRFDGERRLDTSPPPALGEHTAEVLNEWLWADAVRVRELGESGAFG